MSKIAFTYKADQNPHEGTYPGVPLRDLTDDEFNALPNHIKRTVVGSKLYEKVKGVSVELPPDPAKAAAPAEPDAPADHPAKVSRKEG
ncbi:MAG TPA: hypothetical protein VFT66_15640 [Roseiflexaceae bacterium]|nr:hypothetical protein [Roseiflexaceae bacterium]